jgi:hypothetical protein
MMPAAAARAGFSGEGRPENAGRQGQTGVSGLISDRIYTGFCEFHGHPQFDLAQHLVELLVPGALLEVGGDGLQTPQAPSARP